MYLSVNSVWAPVQKLVTWLEILDDFSCLSSSLEHKMFALHAVVCSAARIRSMRSDPCWRSPDLTQHFRRRNSRQAVRSGQGYHSRQGDLSAEWRCKQSVPRADLKFEFPGHYLNGK